MARALEERLSPPRDGAAVAGLGLVHGTAEGFRTVLLRCARKAWIDAPPAGLLPGRRWLVRGRLAPSLRTPELYVEGPDGEVLRFPMVTHGAEVERAIVPESPGRYTLEVLAVGERGPEVVWLDRAWIGAPAVGRGSRLPEPSAKPVELRDLGDPRLSIARAIDRERLRMGKPALARDPKLEEIAQAYSDELARTRRFGHLSLISGDLTARLARAGYRCARAGENLARGPDPLAAHALAVASPAHRKNLLDGAFDRCGVGVSYTEDASGGREAWVTELFAGG